MAPVCAASSKISLPAVLQSVFRAQVASELRSEFQLHRGSFNEYPRRIAGRGLSYSSRPLINARQFSSGPCRQSSRAGKPVAVPQDLPPTVGTENQRSVPADPTIRGEDGVALEANQTGTTTMDPTSRVVDSGEVNTREELRKKSTPGREAKKSQRKGKGEKVSTSGPEGKKKPEPWQIQKGALKKKFDQGWNPAKKLSPDALEGIRQLHATAPGSFTTPVLAEEFKVSPEVIRRILKSKWRPSEEELDDRRERWQRRHDRIWCQMAELGLRPKRKSLKNVSDIRVLYDDKKRGP